MGTTSIKNNIIYGLGEGGIINDSAMLDYSLRWANAAYREMMNRYRFKFLRKRTIFKTSNGQSAYQVPSDLAGFTLLKDETNDNIIDQMTGEEFARHITTNSVSDEEFTSSYGVDVSLDQVAIVQFSEVVTSTDGTVTFVRDVDYTMDYSDGTINVDATGSMSDATAYDIDYLHYDTGKPNKWTLEYDETNNKFVIRFDPVPDATYVLSNLQFQFPDDLSASKDSVYDRTEFAIERGGIYYGSLELIDDPNKRAEFKQNYELAIQALVQLDTEMNPQAQQIPTKMRRTDAISYRPKSTTFG